MKERAVMTMEAKAELGIEKAFMRTRIRDQERSPHNGLIPFHDRLYPVYPYDASALVPLRLSQSTIFVHNSNWRPKLVRHFT